MSDNEDYSREVSPGASTIDSSNALASIQSFSTVGQQSISKIAETIIALNNNKVTITIENVKKIAWDDAARMSSLKFQDALKTACAYLESCLGYELVELPKKQLFNAKGDKRTSGARNFMLINCLNDDYARFVIERHALDQSGKLYESELSDQRKDYTGDKDLHPSLNSDEKLLNNGVILLVISIIILSENTINQDELLKILRNIYGITDITEFTINKKNILDFLKDLDKQEYVLRKVTKGEMNDEVVEYSLGRRARVEFDRESFIEFARIIMDEVEENPEFLKLVNDSIDAAFREEPGSAPVGKKGK